MTKSNNISYSNSFPTNFTTTVQPLNNSISQLNLPVATVEFKTLDYSDSKRRSQSPLIKPMATIVTSGQNFYQTEPGYDTNGLANTYSDDNNEQSENMPILQHQQSCIVSNNCSPPNKEFRISNIPSRSPIPTTVYSITSNMNASIQDKALIRNSFNNQCNKTPPLSQQSVTSKTYSEMGGN